MHNCTLEVTEPVPGAANMQGWLASRWPPQNMERARNEYNFVSSKQIFIAVGGISGQMRCLLY